MDSIDSNYTQEMLAGGLTQEGDGFRLVHLCQYNYFILLLHTRCLGSSRLTLKVRQVT